MPIKQLSALKNFRYHILWFVWLIGISYLSNRPSEGLPRLVFLQFEGADKVVHFVFYFTLSLLMAYGFRKQNAFALSNRQVILVALLFPVFWGGLMELMQLLIFTYRSAEWLDFLANTTGAVVGVSFFSILVNRFIKQS